MSRETTSPATRLCLGAAASSVLSALGLMALWKTEALGPTTFYMLMAIPIALLVFAFVKGLSLTKENTRAAHRYLLRLALTMAFYLITLAIAEHFIDGEGLTGPLAAVLALLPGLSFAGVIWVFGGLIVEETDEFYRMLYVRQGLIATAISFTLAAIWGFLETYNIVEPVAAFWWPTIWCFGLGVGAIFNKVKYGTFGEIR